MHRKTSKLRKHAVIALLRLQQRTRKRASLLQSIVKLLLEIFGLCWLTWAAFSVSSVSGGIMAGISCFILSWHIGTEKSANGG